MVSEYGADTSSALGYFSVPQRRQGLDRYRSLCSHSPPTPSSKWLQIPSDSLPRVFNLRQVTSPVRAAVSLVREKDSSLKRSSVPQVRQSSASLPGLQLDANSRVAHDNLTAEFTQMPASAVHGMPRIIHARYRKLIYWFY